MPEPQEVDFSVHQLTRVEGEGRLSMTVSDGVVRGVQLEIFEAPRYFERLVVGRTPNEVIDIVARICGICPVAYQMSAVHAFERLFEIAIDPEVRRLRRLFYCGEWIESHALHIYLLHAPDFLGYPSAVELAGDHPEIVERGLRLKRLGNRIVAILGGRPIHPVSVRVGGFSRAPRRAELEELAARAARRHRGRPGDRALGRRTRPAVVQPRASPGLPATSRRVSDERGSDRLERRPRP